MKLRGWQLWGLVVLAGCASMTGVDLSARYGEPAVRERTVARLAPGEVDYWTEVKPILDSRCVVCHACYDAPCQLKLTAPEGIDRGATTAQVYNPERLSEAPLTRLFQDAENTAAWRQKGFEPVLNEYPAVQAELQASVLYRMLQLKEKHPLPEVDQLGEEFTLGINRKQSCPTAATFDEFASDHPLWGMPYGMPAISSENTATIEQWLQQGAHYPRRPALTSELQTAVDKWESFLNGDSLTRQLSARYWYEHLFIAHIYFSDLYPENSTDIPFFRLVRSATAPGEAVEQIATRRPYDDPGVTRVYYRLVPEYETIVVKTHMPYALNDARMANWALWFPEKDTAVSEQPGYSAEVAGNPFRAFQALPIRGRYRFLLDEAEFSIMNFIKGPVCRGQAALNVIKDHFWVFFVDPDAELLEKSADFMEQHLHQLEMPSVRESTSMPVTNWVRYSSRQKALMEARDQYLAEDLKTEAQEGKLRGFGLDDVWDGDGINDNAALTVFRNFDSATVEKGLVGRPPQTAWVIGYPLLERIHYLLVAGYDVYGNLGHQLLSRLYMDFLRMEGESAFLMLLPSDARQTERANWYREAPERVMKYLTLPSLDNTLEPTIPYHTDQPKLELYQLLAEHLGAALNTDRQVEMLAGSPLTELAAMEGAQTRFLPQTTVIRVREGDRYQYYTLLRNNAHLNINSMFLESKFLIEEENTVTLAKDIVGSYPNVFFDVQETELASFSQRMTSIISAVDYRRLIDDFGVRRTANNFWEFADQLHADIRQQAGVNAGLLDFNRLENR